MILPQTYDAVRAAVIQTASRIYCPAPTMAFLADRPSVDRWLFLYGPKEMERV